MKIFNRICRYILLLVDITISHISISISPHDYVFNIIDTAISEISLTYQISKIFFFKRYNYMQYRLIELTFFKRLSHDDILLIRSIFHKHLHDIIDFDINHDNNTTILYMTLYDEYNEL